MGAIFSSARVLDSTAMFDDSFNAGDWWGLSGLALLLLSSLFQWLQREQWEEEGEGEKVAEDTPAPAPSWRERLGAGLARSRQDVWGKLANIFSSNEETEELLEEVEELLYGADLGTEVVVEIVESLKDQIKRPNFSQQEFFFNFLKQKMSPVQQPFELQKIVMVVGVNGAGKTTTIGKLATKLTAQGSKVLVGACDTFRAAAVDQLQIWCDRAGASMIRAKEGAAPSGVMHESLQTALAQRADYCILDTAGRLHTKGNLMDELAKCKNVLKKLAPGIPMDVLLVIDSITGQNAIVQAQQFDRALGITGLVLTKCDGSSKAGSAVGIVQKLQKPIVYIGVGEGVDDLNRFDLDDYLHALLGK